MGVRIQVDALSNKGCLLEYVGTRDSMAMSLLIGKGRGDAASCKRAFFREPRLFSNIAPTPKNWYRFGNL